MLLFWQPVYCQQLIRPNAVIRASGGITDFVISGNKIILATEAGTVESYDIISKSKKIIRQLPEVRDFMGDTAPAKILSVDMFGKRLLAVSVGEHGYRNLLIIDYGREKEVISAGHEKMMITKARWLDEARILLSLLSNDFILFDIKQGAVLKRTNVGPYSFSDFCLNEQKTMAFSSDESGVVHQTDLQKLEVVRNFSGLNVDRVFQLDYQNGIILTGGKDRRVGVINTLSDKRYYIQKEFHIYSVGLSRDGATGAFTANEENDIVIFSILTKEEEMILKGHRGLVTGITFIDEHTLVSADNMGEMIIWKLP